MKILISKNDLLNFYRLHSKLETKHLILIVLIMAMIFIYIATTQSNPVALIISGLVGGILGVWFYKYVYITLKSNRIYKQQKSLHSGFDLEITDHGIIISSENGHGSNNWEDFIKYKENSNYLLLYYSDALFTMIPKKQITKASLDILNANLPKISC